MSSYDGGYFDANGDAYDEYAAYPAHFKAKHKRKRASLGRSLSEQTRKDMLTTRLQGRAVIRQLFAAREVQRRAADGNRNRSAKRQKRSDGTAASSVHDTGSVDIADPLGATPSRGKMKPCFTGEHPPQGAILIGASRKIQLDAVEVITNALTWPRLSGTLHSNPSQKELKRARTLQVSIFTILARLDSVRDMEASEVSTVRELGKRAVELIRTRADALADGVAGNNASEHDDEAEEDDYDDDSAPEGPFYSEDEEELPDLEKVSRLLERLDAEWAANQAAAKKQTSKKRNTEAVEQQKADATADEHALDPKAIELGAYATLFMVVTIVGDVYSQRDLLPEREVLQSVVEYALAGMEAGAYDGGGDGDNDDDKGSKDMEIDSE